MHDSNLVLVEEYSALLKDWNRFVPKYNAAILRRDVGRPLRASEAQQKQVLKHHRSGMSLRDIAEEMTLSLRTVRTIIERGEGRDRATRRRLEKVDPEKAAVVSARARKRTRDALPKMIKAIEDENAAIKKAVKGLA